MGENLSIKFEIIVRDNKFWKTNMEENLKILYFNHLLPELMYLHAIYVYGEETNKRETALIYVGACAISEMF